MADNQPLTMHQGNDETIEMTIEREDTDDDLTTVAVLEVRLKPDVCTDDDAASVLLLTSADASEVVILTQSVTAITAEAYVPAAYLAEPYDRVWRVDGLSGTGERRTALFGKVTVEDL